MKDKLKSLWHFFFGDSARAFGSMSLILLVLLAISPAKDHFSQWRRFQKQYLHVIRGRADAVTLERHFPSGIQQIWIPKIAVTDRCITCHLGYEWSSVLPASIAEPLKPHPMNDWMTKHEFAKFGCTPCHGGNGAAITSVWPWCERIKAATCR